MLPRFKSYRPFLIGPTLLFTPALANADPCPPTSLAYPMAPGFSCTVGGNSYSSFNTALISTLVDITNSTENVQAVPSGGGSNRGFGFDANCRASGLATDSLSFLCAAAPMSERFFMKETLTLTKPVVTGAASLTAHETLCLNGASLPLSFCSSGGRKKFVELSSLTGNLDAVETISLEGKAATEVGVLKTTPLAGLNGTASASAINNRFTVTPEPALLGLLGGGLLFAGLALRRRSTGDKS